MSQYISQRMELVYAAVSLILASATMGIWGSLAGMWLEAAFPGSMPLW